MQNIVIYESGTIVYRGMYTGLTVRQGSLRTEVFFQFEPQGRKGSIERVEVSLPHRRYTLASGIVSESGAPGRSQFESDLMQAVIRHASDELWETMLIAMRAEAQHRAEVRTGEQMRERRL